MKHEWPIVEEQIGSRQWIFDRVVRHYRAQPRRCALNHQCQYWLDGDRCFVGALMSEAEAKDAPTWAIDVAIEAGIAPEWMGRHKDFLTAIQSLHDTETNWPDGRMNMVLELFAAERGLRMPA